MEADLSEYHQVDYLDRWRGGLTLRRIWVLLRWLPEQSRVAGIIRDGPLWTIEAHLLDDLRVALTSTKKKRAQSHPSRPAPRSQADPQMVERRRRATEAFAERRRRAKQAD